MSKFYHPPDEDPVTGSGNVTGVSLNQNTADITTGTTLQLTASITTADGTNTGDVVWSSSNGFATVDSNGLVTGQSAGTTTITVTTVEGGFTATCVVTVKDPPSGVYINKDSTTIGVGNFEQLTAVEVPDIGGLIWTSSVPAVATVDSTGKITGVAPGSTIITVTTADGNYSDTCSVLVVKEFISTWYVGATWRDIKLPLVESGNYNFKVNWEIIQQQQSLPGTILKKSILMTLREHIQ